MFLLSDAPKLMSTMMLSGLLLIVLILPFKAQERIIPQQTDRAVTVLNSNKEKDGLIGAVRRVRTEVTKLSWKSGKLVEGRRALIETTTYDIKGNRVENIYYPVAVSAPPGKEEYKYDLKGNITEMIRRDSHGSILSKEVYTYEFDTVGNWIKMITHTWTYGTGKLTSEPTEVTYRTITYYFDQTIDKIIRATSKTRVDSLEAAATNSSSAPQTEKTLIDSKAVARPDTTPASSASLKLLNQSAGPESERKIIGSPEKPDDKGVTSSSNARINAHRENNHPPRSAPPAGNNIKEGIAQKTSPEEKTQSVVSPVQHSTKNNSMPITDPLSSGAGGHNKDGAVYYISGLVNKRGAKVFRPGITLQQAIAAAGGLRPISLSLKALKKAMTTNGLLGSRQEWYSVKIIRTGADRQGTRIIYKLKDIESGKVADPTLQPEDRIEVFY